MRYGQQVTKEMLLTSIKQQQAVKAYLNFSDFSGKNAMV